MNHVQPFVLRQLRVPPAMQRMTRKELRRVAAETLNWSEHLPGDGAG